jgi:hypothetical protein
MYSSVGDIKWQIDSNGNVWLHCQWRSMKIGFPCFTFRRLQRDSLAFDGELNWMSSASKDFLAHYRG